MPQQRPSQPASRQSTPNAANAGQTRIGKRFSTRLRLAPIGATVWRIGKRLLAENRQNRSSYQRREEADKRNKADRAARLAPVSSSGRHGIRFSVDTGRRKR